MSKTEEMPWQKLDESSPILALADGWDFYWKILLSPKDSLPEPNAVVSIGQVWNGIVLKDGSKVPKYGYASYRKVLKALPPRPQGYQIGLEQAGQAFNLIVFPSDRPDQAQVSKSGVVHPQKSSGSRRYVIQHLRPEKTEDYTVIIQVSNANYAYGGAYYPLQISVGPKLSDTYELEGLFNLIGMGITIGIGIYSFMMWVRRRSERAALMLAFTAFSSMMRSASSSPFIVNFYSDSLFEVVIRLSYSSMLFGSASYLAFLLYSFRDEKAPLFVKSVLITALGIGLCTLIVPLEIFTEYLIVFQLMVLLTGMIYLWIVHQAVRLKKPGSGLVLVGCSLICLSFITDSLLANFSNTSFYVTPFAVMLFLILQSQLVALRAAQSYWHSERLAAQLTSKNDEITFFNRNLESMVEQKTADIRSLLDNIPQGIFSIGQGTIISADHSRHLLSILGHNPIAKQSFDSAFLSRVHMDKDHKDQIIQTLNATLGETELTFELNSDKLPKEFIFDSGSQQKFLKATWSTVLDHDNKVSKVLVTLLDLSHEKLLEQDINRNKKQLEMIEELLETSPENMRQFFATSLPLLLENQRILEHATIEQSSIRVLLVNAHTVKGAARTLHLRSLAAAIHQAEDRYSANLLGLAPDMSLLRQDCQAILTVFQEYKQINVKKLNRSEESSRLSFDRKFIMHQYDLLDDFLNTKQPKIEEMLNIMRQQRDALTPYIFEKLERIFDNYREQAKNMAIDLGKDPPQFEWDLPTILVTQEEKIVLDSTMIHVLRNTMDHGIEASAERSIKGKNRHGTLYIQGYILQNQLVLKISDDGRGLAMGDLLQRGIQRGYLTTHSSPQDIAESIFQTGVTTALATTDISGRGIGMDAARSFLRGVGGDLRIELGQSVSNDERYCSFTLELSLNLSHIKADKQRTA